jgi:hypothetical protein
MLSNIVQKIVISIQPTSVTLLHKCVRLLVSLCILATGCPKQGVGRGFTLGSSVKIGCKLDKMAA